MYPREITSTSAWIRHNLPLGPPLPPNGNEKLRKQIKSRNIKSTDEVIEQYVRQERARLDLKWCLDEFFGWNVPDPYLGQLVTANLFGSAHLAYIIDVTFSNIIVTPVDMFGKSMVVGFDDIDSAEDGPFYENFLLNHHLFHPQHVLDNITNWKCQERLVEFNHDESFRMIITEFMYGNSEIEWTSGDETWLVHDELPQRTQFVEYRDQVMLNTSTFNIVEHLLQPTSVDYDCVLSSSDQQPHDIILLLQQFMVKQDALLERNKLIKENLARQNTIINQSVSTIKATEKNKILEEAIDSTSNHEEQTLKQLQSQQIDQLIKCPSFFESYPQCVQWDLWF